MSFSLHWLGNVNVSSNFSPAYPQLFSYFSLQVFSSMVSYLPSSLVSIYSTITFNYITDLKFVTYFSTFYDQFLRHININYSSLPPPLYFVKMKETFILKLCVNKISRGLMRKIRKAKTWKD